MSVNSVSALIELHEGRRAKPYPDSRGKLTIGVGRCLDTKPLKDFEIDFLRDNDIRDADQSCIAIFGAAVFAGFAVARQAVLTDLAFQLGQGGLSKFVKLIAAANAGDWDGAGRELLESDLAKQTPNRARQNAMILLSGEWPKS